MKRNYDGCYVMIAVDDADDHSKTLQGRPWRRVNDVWSSVVVITPVNLPVNTSTLTS